MALPPYHNTLPYPVTMKTRNLSLLQGYTLSIYCSYPVCSIISKSNCFLLLQNSVLLLTSSKFIKRIHFSEYRLKRSLHVHVAHTHVQELKTAIHLHRNHTNIICCDTCIHTRSYMRYLPIGSTHVHQTHLIRKYSWSLLHTCTSPPTCITMTTRLHLHYQPAIRHLMSCTSSYIHTAYALCEDTHHFSTQPVNIYLVKVWN